MNVGKRFKEILKQRGYEPKRFAGDHGFTWSDLRAFANENAKASPTVRRILKFIIPLNVTLAEFFAGENKLPNQYWDTKREQIMLTSDQQVWVDKLLKLLQSGDRARILMLQGMLEWEPGTPEQVPIKKLVPRPRPKIKALRSEGKKEKAG